MLKDKLTGALLGAAMVAGVGASFLGIASAQMNATGTAASGTSVAAHAERGMGVMGTVSAVSGNTLTVTGKNSTTYSVDVTNAKILKMAAGTAPTTITVSAIAVGDTVAVRGTVSGTTVTATEVMDGVFKGGMGHGPMMGDHRGVAGTITAVSGNTVTITKADGTTYTVDATSASISKMVTLTVSDLKVGDKIAAEGTVSGTTVTATHIMDGVPPFGGKDD